LFFWCFICPLHVSGTHADSAEAIVTGGFQIGGQGVPLRHGNSAGTGQLSQPIDKSGCQNAAQDTGTVHKP
jgi:hypothetical protein